MTKWTRLLAYHLVQTTEPEEAVRRAVAMIFGNPVTMDERGEKLWVPTQYDVEAVKSLAGTLVRQAVGPEVVESDDQSPGAVEIEPAVGTLPTTRTIRGVPLDGRGLGPNVVKAAAVSSRPGDKEPPIHERDEKIRNMLPRPPRQQPPDIRNTLNNSDVDAIWSETLARQFETKDQPNDGSGTYYFKDGGWVYGKYQMRKGSLQDIGMMDKAGNWTGKYGVRNWQDFLHNPAAQDAALIDWTKN